MRREEKRRGKYDYRNKCAMKRKKINSAHRQHQYAGYTDTHSQGLIQTDPEAIRPWCTKHQQTVEPPNT